MDHASAANAPTPVSALRQRLAADPSSPLITYYDDDTGERVELSAATFNNWVAKTANLLVDEFTIDTDTVVSIRLPTHWQTLAWMHACWLTGATVDLTTRPGTGSIVVVSRALADETVHEKLTHPRDIVVLALAPLARPGPPPPTPAFDYDREVAGYADRFGGPTPSPATVAATFDDGEISQAALVDQAYALMRDRPLANGQRIEWTGSLLSTAADVATASIVPLLNGGGLLLTHGTNDVARLHERRVTERTIAWP